MAGPYVPIEDLAKHFSVSVSTIRAWVRNRHIPTDTYVKIGNTYRFCISDVSEALTKSEKQLSTTAVVEDVPEMDAYAGGIGRIVFDESDKPQNLDDDL